MVKPQSWSHTHTQSDAEQSIHTPINTLYNEQNIIAFMKRQHKRQLTSAVLRTKLSLFTQQTRNRMESVAPEETI